jgi:hypothetical protein
MELAKDIFIGETIPSPNIRLLHPIKGRIPENNYLPAAWKRI